MALSGTSAAGGAGTGLLSIADSDYASAPFAAASTAVNTGTVPSDDPAVDHPAAGVGPYNWHGNFTKTTAKAEKTATPLHLSRMKHALRAYNSALTSSLDATLTLESIRRHPELFVVLNVPTIKLKAGLPAGAARRKARKCHVHFSTSSDSEPVFIDTKLAPTTRADVIARHSIHTTRGNPYLISVQDATDHKLYYFNLEYSGRCSYAYPNTIRLLTDTQAAHYREVNASRLLSETDTNYFWYTDPADPSNRMMYLRRVTASLHSLSEGDKGAEIISTQYRWLLAPAKTYHLGAVSDCDLPETIDLRPFKLHFQVEGPLYRGPILHPLGRSETLDELRPDLDFTYKSPTGFDIEVTTPDRKTFYFYFETGSGRLCSYAFPYGSAQLTYDIPKGISRDTLSILYDDEDDYCFYPIESKHPSSPCFVHCRQVQVRFATYKVVAGVVHEHIGPEKLMWLRTVSSWRSDPDLPESITLYSASDYAKKYDGTVVTLEAPETSVTRSWLSALSSILRLGSRSARVSPIPIAATAVADTRTESADMRRLALRRRASTTFYDSFDAPTGAIDPTKSFSSNLGATSSRGTSGTSSRASTPSARGGRSLTPTTTLLAHPPSTRLATTLHAHRRDRYATPEDTTDGSLGVAAVEAYLDRVSAAGAAPGH